MAHRLSSDVVPSKVLQTPWIYAEPSLHTLLQDYDPTKIGKWMLFLDSVDANEDGLTKLDLYWPSIINLVKEGILIDAKCSTALSSYDGRSNGVIICYTDDYTNIEKIHAAAKSIRKVVDYSQPMYYKTDTASQNKQYRRTGAKAISIYQYSVDHKLYERDDFAQWQLVKLSKSHVH